MGKVKQIAIHNTVYTLEGDKTSIIANHAIPNTWHTSGTMVQLISDINNDETATEGKSYTGTVSLSDLPASMAQAEMKIEITKGSTSGNKIILFTIASENTTPYHWERVSAYGRSGNWRSFLPDKNIDSTATNNSNDLITSGAVYNAVANKADGSSLGYPIFDENTNYAANDTVFYNGKLYFFNQAHNAGAWDSSEVSPSSIKASLNALTTSKVDRVQNATNGNIAVLNSSGNIVDAGLAIVKMNKAEYDALVTKNPLTVYLVESTNDLTFGGIKIAPAPLYYGANGFEIKDTDWTANSYGTLKGTVEGSYFFNFIELGSYFDSDGQNFTINSGSIDNANKLTYNNHQWCVPTMEDWNSIFSDTREGSIVDNVQHVRFAVIYEVTMDEEWCGDLKPGGYLLFPDGANISGCSKSFITNTYSVYTNTCSYSELNEYIEKGCCFIPDTAYYYNMWRSSNLNSALYVISDENSTNDAKGFCLNSGNVYYINVPKEGSGAAWTFVRLISKQIDVCTSIYLGSTLIADSNTINDIASILATI